MNSELKSAVVLREEGCPVCGSHDGRSLGKPGRLTPKFDRIRSEIKRVEPVRCERCSLVYVSPMVYYSPEFLADLYNIEYFGKTDDGVNDLKNMGEKRAILRKAQKIAGSLRGKTLLDIGCGTGEYIKVALEFGMRPTGADVEPSITEHVARKYGVPVFTGEFNRDSFPSDSFHVIVLSHVVEHVPQPKRLLADIHSTLKPGGLFVMATPNIDSLMEKLHDLYGHMRRDRSKCYSLTPFISPYHILGFNRKSAVRLLGECGFEPILIEIQSGLRVKESNRNPIMLAIKLLGTVVRQGISICAIGRKPAN